MSLKCLILWDIEFIITEDKEKQQNLTIMKLEGGFRIYEWLEELLNILADSFSVNKCLSAQMLFQELCVNKVSYSGISKVNNKKKKTCNFHKRASL